MYHNNQVPNEVDSYINRGIQRGEKTKKSNRMKKWSVISSLLVISLFISAIGISPAFAKYVSKVPVLGSVAEWIMDERFKDFIHFDKGLENAMKSEYAQHITISDVHDGIGLIVNDVFVDKSGMVVLYTLENNTEYDFIMMDETVLKDGDGNEIQCGMQSSNIGGTGMLQYDFTYIANPDGPGQIKDFKIPDTFVISTNMKPMMRDDINISGVWKVTIPVDTMNLDKMEREYPLNKTFKVADQNITVDNVTIYPTKIAIDITYDPNNTMDIFALENLVLVDDTGIEWKLKDDGNGRPLGPDGNKRKMFFESTFFTSPIELYLKGTAIRCVDKDDKDLVIDIDNKTILKAPDDKVELAELELQDDTLSFNLDVNNKDKNKYNNIGIGGHIWLNRAYDKNGVILYNQSADGFEYSFQYKSEKSLQGPVTFLIMDYPNWIDEDFSVKLISKD